MRSHCHLSRSVQNHAETKKKKMLLKLNGIGITSAIYAMQLLIILSDIKVQLEIEKL